MKLPKQLKKENIESDVQAELEKEQIPLCADSEILIPLLTLNQELRKQIFYAKAAGELIFGYDSIDKSLRNELTGLKNINNQADRVSRLLLVPNNGKNIFYQGLELLLDRQGDRLMICRLDVEPLTMGNILGFKTRNINAILLSRKTSVSNILKSLLAREK